MTNETPTIAIVIETRLRLGFNPRHFCHALNTYVNGPLARWWGVTANFLLRQSPRPTDWVMEILGKSDLEGAEGYHDLTPDGSPHMKIFVDDTREAGEMLTVCGAHEAAETLVDRYVNLCADRGDGTFAALENADPVQADVFAIDGVSVSNFVTPHYFNPDAPSGAALDCLGLVEKPFEIRPGGYLSIFTGGAWTEQTVDEEGKKAAAKSGRARARLARRSSCGYSSSSA